MKIVNLPELCHVPFSKRLNKRVKLNLLTRFGIVLMLASFLMLDSAAQDEPGVVHTYVVKKENKKSKLNDNISQKDPILSRPPIGILGCQINGSTQVYGHMSYGYDLTCDNGTPADYWEVTCGYGVTWAGNYINVLWNSSTCTSGSIRAYKADGTLIASRNVSITILPQWEDNVYYYNLYDSSNFVKTIDLSKPVGVIQGTVGNTPSGGITYSIPVYSPPGTNGNKPGISIDYNSQSGNGVAGFGWNISGLSVISRAGKDIYHNGVVKPVNNTTDDAFVLDGIRLNPVSGSNGANGTIYAGEVEAFSKIISNTTNSPNNPDWFQVVAKDGSTMEFGKTTDSRILSDDGVNVMLWRLNRVIDINGNYIDFVYDNVSRDSRIKIIKYTGNINTGLAPYNSFTFQYKARTDRNTVYEAGGSLSSMYLLDEIIVIADDNFISRRYKLHYSFDNVTSLLKEVVESGSDGSELNSTIFLYGGQPENMLVQSTSAPANCDFFTGDFDGDGKTDLAEAPVSTQWMPNYRINYHSQYQVKNDIIQNPSNTLFIQNLTSGTTINYYNQKQCNFLTADYNGDSRDDIMLLNTSVVLPTASTPDQPLYLNNININYSGTNLYTTTNLPLPANYLYNKKGNFIIPGDFDGDGNADYILLAGTYPSYNDPHNYNSKAFFTSPVKSIYNQEILNIVPFSSFAEVMANAQVNLPGDFDGDGKTDILVISDQVSYILGTDFIGSSAFSIIQTLPNLNKDCKVFPGDFNGDHKTDLLVRYANGYYEILYSTGVSFVNIPFNFNQSVNLSSGLDANILQIADFNGDGKSDILHGYKVNGNSKFSVYYSRGLGESYYQQYDYINNLPTGVDGSAQGFVVGDFNGDGRADVICKTPYGPTDFITFTSPTKKRLLAKVTDGYNNTTSFQYKNLTDNDPSFYERTISLDATANQYPFNYAKLPFIGVSSITSPDGIGGTNTTSFKYENVLMHRAGKGFLGFKKITAQNSASGITSVTENNLNTQFVIQYPTRQSNYLTSTNQLLSESQITTSFDDLSNGGLKRFIQKTDKVLSIDYLNGTASENVNTYDNYGNVVTNVSKIGTLSGSTVNAVETGTTTTVYSIHNTPVPALPDNITVSKVRSGMSAKNATTQFTYAANGLVNSKTDFAGLAKAVTTSYAYNALGNTVTTTTSAAGLNSRTVNFTYDLKNRFVLAQQLTGTNLLQTESSTYDPVSGNPLTQTSSDCLTTSFNYDGFGRLVVTTVPQGYDMYNSLNWDIQNRNIFYSFTDYPGGAPDVKTWFDGLGREIKKQTAGFNSQWLTQLTSYDPKGNVATKTNSFLPSESPIITTNSYDTYNRLYSISNSLNTIISTFTPLNGGRMQVVTQDVTGQSSTKITDATGKVVIAIDDGGQLDYTYDSQGNQTQVTHGGTVIVTTAFDNYGRQTALIDKDAGTTIYDYDALGQLIQQIDNNGSTYNMSYDDFGRITSRQGPEGITTYEYYKDVATGCSNNALSKITGFNGINKEYTFDNLKRPQTERVTIDNIDYITQYQYDSYGNLASTTYPSGVVVNNGYDVNGDLVIVTGGDASRPTTIFNGTQMNGFGHYTDYTLGNGRTTQNTYTNGMPTRLYTAGIQDLNMSFNYAKGNLLSRNDAIKNITENFQYDALNRFTEASVNGTSQLNINFDGNSSFSLGNIVSKTDAGNYVYRNDKIHAVAYITNPAGPTALPVTIPVTEQTIAYTPFLKTSSIIEDAYRMDYTYDADYQRAKSILQQNNTIIETKYYVGNYEKSIKNGVTQEIHYLSGGNGLCAIIVRESGVNNFYFIYTDHLGSLLTVTDINGTVVGEQNFDAWGRHRNPNTWQYTNIPAIPVWLYRGYTGHEHMSQFGLINMNGRMYDPIQGRMLSPDNYVSDPLHTQGYNRYSYAMNNPLSYVDPDGNIAWFIPMIIGAVVGGVQSGIQAQAEGHSFISGAWKGSIVGAVGGGLALVGGGSFLANVEWGIGEGIATNGLSNLLNHRSFFSGAGGAGFWGGAFAAFTSFQECLKNDNDGYGFGTNDGRIKSMMEEGQYDEAITFIRKRWGMSDSRWTTGYAGKNFDAGRPRRDAETMLNPFSEDISAHSAFGTRAVTSVSKLKSTIAHEYGHFKTIGKVGDQWEFIDQIDPLSNYMDGWEGYTNSIKMSGQMNISTRTLKATVPAAENSPPFIKYGGGTMTGRWPQNPAWYSKGLIKSKWLYTIPRRYSLTNYF